MIAKELGVTPKAVQHRYDRAKSKALQSLQRAEYVSPDFAHDLPSPVREPDPIDSAT
ncbi:hypothetical protein AB0I35_31265 [Nocardia sp. NPDC050378]|uniref:hypothetical protein n=1 Tax=Nocardia sp. NPDC050378 TaxID=3155400 RepID=UPI0033C258A9